MPQTNPPRVQQGRSLNALLSNIGGDASLVHRISNADVVILPLAGGGKPLFPANSIELLRDIRETLPDRSVEIAAADQDYREFGLHGALLDLGELLIKHVLVPLIPNILWDLIKKRANLKLDTQVKIRLIVVPPDPAEASVHIEYEGKAEDVPIAFSKSLASNIQQKLGCLPASSPPEKGASDE